ncbi:asparaginyl-tRNA synthetase-like isoform X2 [Amphiura filiformis]|uniref:asparaginyl-tRNA synthetase-like isoform X2 n=1 Tax=Amphiura filiformis TaxID=82378 RepID=UPI003B21B2FC
MSYKRVHQGWIKSVREQKHVMFLSLHDGSCIDSLQIVAKEHVCTDGIAFGCSVEVRGHLIPSKSKGQKVELSAEEIKVIGPCDNEIYPLKARTRHSADYTRQIPHLRSRTNTFSSLLRIRNSATQAVHAFFQEAGFLQVDTPIITSNDCEGAGETFTVQPANPVVLEDVEKNSNDKSGLFFNVPAFLTVSGQLHLEIVASSHQKVYTLGPTFRAENSSSRRHLSEFYMLEVEEAFADSVEDIMKLTEDCVKSVTHKVCNQSQDDVELFHKHVSPGHKDVIDKLLGKPFTVLSYTDAINILEKHRKQFEFDPKWGCDLLKEHEKFLVSHCDNIPVFVVDYPADIKPFYAKSNDDPSTVAAVDLLVPDVGELVGGTVREDRLDILQQRLDDLKLTDSYQWYLDLRRFGNVPHSGFGLGFERYLQFLLGVEHIRDVIPFPRYAHSCLL